IGHIKAVKRPFACKTGLQASGLRAPLWLAHIAHDLVRQLYWPDLEIATTEPLLITTPGGPLKSSGQRGVETMLTCPIALDDRGAGIAAVDLEVSGNALKSTSRERRVLDESNGQRCSAAASEVFQR